jgi:DNA/RNA endonuclease G (NUC1)
LAPDADFIDAGSQDATYYYINAAPQWQSFNNGNWKALEAGTRDLAISRSIDLVVYTGTFETLTLANVNGVQKPIYLAVDANNNNVIPAPKYYWKVVHDPATNKATAFIGINNPHLTTVTGADVFCNDVCSQVGWMTWSNRFDIPKGYMFCCTSASLHNVVTHSPNLGNIGLLV